MRGPPLPILLKEERLIDLANLKNLWQNQIQVVPKERSDYLGKAG